MEEVKVQYEDEETLVVFKCVCGEFITGRFFDESDVPDEDLDDDGHDEVDCECGRTWNVKRPQKPTMLL